jgi:hypothetical protein
MLALHGIKNHENGKLWRAEGYSSFEEYCRSRFKFQKQHAYRLAAAGELVSSLDTGTPKPLRESQVRPILNKISEPKQRTQAWKSLVENHDPAGLTAPQVEAHVRDYVKQNNLKPAEKKKKEPSMKARSSRLDRKRQKCHRLIERLEQECQELPSEDQIRHSLDSLKKLVNQA